MLQVNIKEKEKQSTKNKEEKEMNEKLSFLAEKVHQPTCTYIAFCIDNSNLFNDDYITNFSGDFVYFIHELEMLVTMLALFHFN